MLQRESFYLSYTDESGNEVMEIFDSDEDIRAEPTPKAVKTRGGRVLELPTFASLADDETLEEDVYMPDMHELSQSRRASSQSDLSTYVRDDTASQTDEDAFTPVTARKRKAPSTDASSLADSRDESPVPAKKKRTKKDPEEARLEKEAKAQAKKLETERKKQEKVAEVERKKREKEAEKDRKAQEKAAENAEKQTYSELNKLTTSKTSTLQYMTIEFHPSLCSDAAAMQGHLEPLINRIAKEADLPMRMNTRPSWPITRMKVDERFPEIDSLVRWRRHIRAKYIEAEKEWQPVEPYTRIEGLYALYHTLAQVLQQLQLPEAQRPISRNLRKLRSELGPKHQLFLIVDESKNGKLTPSQKERVEEWLGELSVELNCHAIQAKDSESVVSWFYNITADLGIKPHKIIQRSHLPFCPTTTPHTDKADGKLAKTQTTTYRQMLRQVSRITDPMTEEITRQPQFRTLRKLFETYTDPTTSRRAKEEALVGLHMGRTKAGQQSSRNFGIVTSSRVCAVFTSHDSLELVGKEK